MNWIVVPNWDRFQHYKNRNPVWIKAYPELLSDDAYLGLTFHQRGVLHGIWMEYARANRQLPDSTLTVSRRLGDRVSTATLKALVDAGFVEVSASKPLAPRYHDASPEGEGEKEPFIPPNGGNRNCRNCGHPVAPRAHCPNCGASPRKAGTNPRALSDTSVICPDCGLKFQGPIALADHVENVHW